MRQLAGTRKGPNIPRRRQDETTRMRKDRLVVLANTPVELNAIFDGRRVGAKQPVQFEFGIGGAGGNGAPVAGANGIRADLIAVQSRAQAEPCRQQVGERGMTGHIVARDSADAAITVSYPNGHAGKKQLLVQRCPPITQDELTPFLPILDQACLFIVGPMQIINGPKGAETLNLLKSLPEMAPRAYCAIQPHPSMIADARFAEVASRYRSVQINGDESKILPCSGGVRDRIAYLRDLLGENTDITITNGARRGWMWSDGQYWAIDPISVDVASDLGAGDVFCFAMSIARAYYGANVPSALNYALRQVATIISRSGAVAPFPAQAVPV